MQPFLYDLRCSAAKGDSITHAPVMPRNLDAAITMRFKTSCRKPASLFAHGNTTWQQACSHSTAICSQEFKNHIELRTNDTRDTPLIAEHRRGTNQVRNDRSCTRRTPEVPLSDGRSHFTRQNTKFCAPACSQNEAHATSMQP